MRKRERDSIVKKLTALHEEMIRNGAGQLGGAIWYFDNNAEIKGFDFAYAAANWAETLGKKLKKLLDAEAKRIDQREAKERAR